MRKKAVIIVFVLIVGALCIGPLLNWLSTEPKYQGRTASHWFKQYYQSSWLVYGNVAKQEDAEEALRALGTNAVPLLLSYYYSTNNDSAFQTNLVALCAKLPSWLEVGPFANESIKREMAFNALLKVQPPAEFIVPLVTNHLYSADGIEVAATLELLSHLKVGLDAAMPILNQMLASTNGIDQSNGLDYLQSYGSEAAPAVSAIAKLIESNETDPSVIELAYHVLKVMGHAGSNAVPAILARFRALENTEARVNLATTLCLMSPHQPDAIGFLLNLATNVADPLRTETLIRFQQIEFNALSGPPLTSLVAKNDMWALASTILLALGETESILRPVEDQLSQLDTSRRMEAALFILKHDPTRESAITNLLEIIQDKTRAAALFALESQWKPSMIALTAAGKEIAANPSHPLHEKASRMVHLIEKTSLMEVRDNSISR